MSKGFDIEVLFDFVAEHPAMACVCGGILFLLLGGFLILAAQWTAAIYFIIFGFILFIVGIVLHLLWLGRE